MIDLVTISQLESIIFNAMTSSESETDNVPVVGYITPVIQNQLWSIVGRGVESPGTALSAREPEVESSSGSNR